MAGQGFSLAALKRRPDPGLLSRPLQYIAADIYRERMLCAILAQMADRQRLDPRASKAALAFLRHDLPLHIRDMDEDLLPLLCSRALPQDRIDELIDRLRTDHALAAEDLETVCAVLQAQGSLQAGWPASLATFVAKDRRHLTIENAVLLPLCEARLRQRDRQSLGESMAARRGLYGGNGGQRTVSDGNV